MSVPTQPSGQDTCTNCGEVIHLANHQLGPVWLHKDGITWCRLAAVPAGQPWPEHPRQEGAS